MVGVALALCVTELVARVFLPHWAPVSGERVGFWQYHPTLGWAHEPGQNGRLHHPDFDIAVAINSHGLRDREYPLERTSKKRMLVLGDSFGWGLGVELNERFSERIEAAHDEWEVINASVSGYGTDQELLYLRERGLGYAPDVVLLLLHENDFHNNSSAVEYWYAKPYFVVDGDTLSLRNTPVPGSSFKQRCNRFFYGRTYVFSRMYAAVAHATREMRRSTWLRESGAGNGAGITHALIAEMNRECARASARLVVVSVPLSEGARVIIHSVCKSEGIPYLSLGTAFTRDGRTLTFEHDGHWTPQGHEVAADAVGDFLNTIDVFDTVTKH